MAFQILPEVSLETKLILAIYFVGSCSWIVFLKKHKRILAANHFGEIKLSHFLFLVYRFHWRLKQSKTRPIRMLSHWRTWFSKSLQVFFPCEHDMISHMCTFNIGHPVLLLDMLFSLLWQQLWIQNCWLHAQNIQSIPL